jgi:hypothetical protein
LGNLLNENKLDEAAELASKLKPELSEHPAMQDLLVRLEGLQRSETDRRAAFQKAFAAARAAGLDQPDRTALAEARKLGRDPGEIAALNELESQIRARQRELQSARDERFGQALTPLLEQAAKLDANPAETLGTESRLKALQKAGQDANALRLKGDGVSTELQENLALLERQLDAMLRTELELQRQQASLSAITTAVGNAKDFGERLTKYAQEFPKSLRAADFARAPDET